MCIQWQSKVFPQAPPAFCLPYPPSDIDIFWLRSSFLRVFSRAEDLRICALLWIFVLILTLLCLQTLVMFPNNQLASGSHLWSNFTLAGYWQYKYCRREMKGVRWLLTISVFVSNWVPRENCLRVSRAELESHQERKSLCRANPAEFATNH